MKKFPVLLISSEFPPGPGGIGKHAYDLSRALAAQGHEVTICASQDFSSEEEINQFNNNLPKGLNLIRFTRTGVTTQLNRWSAIRKEINRLQPGMIIVSGRFSLWMGYAVGKWYGKKFPVHAFVHGSEFKKNNSLHHFLTLQSLKSIPHIWAVSEFTRQLVESKTSRKGVLILPNGVWINDWSESLNDNFRPVLKGQPALITVGRVSRRKGQHRVVNALPALLNLFPELHYHIIGIADSSQPVAKLAAQLGMESNITFHGRIPSLQKLASLYRSAGVFIMLSENQPDGEVEGFGIAVLEANYFGIPAIGSREGGISDAIIDGYNGRLVEGNDAEAIRNAFKDIFENMDAYRMHAKEWAQRHDWNRLVEYFLRNESPEFLKTALHHSHS